MINNSKQPWSNELANLASNAGACQGFGGLMNAYQQVQEGRKNDEGKCRLDLFPWDALWETGKVYTTGAGIYDDWNWANGLKYSRMIGALLRHLLMWIMGETFDKKDGQHHLSSVVFYGLGLLHFDLNRERFKEFDDRREGWRKVWE